MSKEHCDILIQGGGPVGLACAAWCLQKFPEAKIALLDRNPMNDADLAAADSRGIALSHGSKLLLDTIDAWPTGCADIHRVHVSQAGRFGRALMTREELKQDALGHIVRYRDIHLSLRKALRAIQKNSPNFVWEHINTNTDTSNIQAQCVVHAEGGLFKTQDWVESGRDYEQSALVGLVEVENAAPHQAWERFTSEGPLAVLPSHYGPNILNLVWCGTPNSSQARLALSDAQFLKNLQAEFGSRIGQFLKIQDRRLYELGLNYRKEITQGHEVWIGNAAQTLHPVAGQGLNLGLRDAYLLAEKLSTLFSKSEEQKTSLAVQEILGEYAQSRKADRTATIGLTDFMARIFTSNLFPIVIGRGLALSALQWLPPVKTALARQMMFGRR
ncbi:MAG: ubiquinone biosynthesis protein UbiH [Polynucleobacter sp. 17-46-58]|jgi:2-octaprenyl-6-methoxyphenol hydroxylase|nr:MAG: ubiquinone biosynthesis protein UbiH [Polynucleobacter sp. 35-46-207]OYZ37268.1 MAG: ubiquinone biosynthesis protein UbiH [Polynucleobacter sp. 16-46-70]OZA40899.1 MAG: ubiquinone biosynthesis protein UbiH [Polynucleobacter sp. 17-46-58]OZB48630.1 MAG: ubiquinone biosynthesis protein UbiH [Polynucleobacter sp. 39-45-136]HQR84952.1 FAD-dependent monooxygenase [Polynucleobacter sp.]